MQLNAAAGKSVCVWHRKKLNQGCIYLLGSPGTEMSYHYVLSLSMHPVAFKYPSGTVRMTD